MADPREEFLPTPLTLERAAKRFLQAQDIETSVRLIERSIAEMDNQVDEIQGRRRALASQRTELLRQLRANACDEGDLPLIDLMEKFPDSEVPVLTLMRELSRGAGA